MALSQKHEGKCLVPWFCSAEWHFVHNKIFGENVNEQTRREALDIINIWKSRTPFLSRGVEGTYIILEAVLIDRNLYDDHNLKLLLSTTIMRFLNICAAYNKNQGSFYTTAYKMKIPEWLVNLRHDVAHGQNLPSMDILDRALKFSLEWLNQEYWKPTSTDITDFIDDTQHTSDKIEFLKYILQPLVSNYCYITLLTHRKWNYKSITDIADKETRNIFLEEIKSMANFDGFVETTELNTVLEVLWQKITFTLNGFEDLENRYHILADLITEDVFLGNIDDREEIFKNTDKVPKEFITLWKHMFNNLATDMIGALIETLLNILSMTNTIHESKIVAATWLFEIGKGLDKCMFAKNTLKELFKKGGKFKKMQSIADEKVAGKYGKKTILDFHINVEIPDVISDTYKFKKLFLKKPTEYTKLFITKFLDLNDTFKLPNIREQILELVNVYISNINDIDVDETTPVIEIHNVEELETAMDIDNEKNEEIEEKTEVTNVDNVNINTNVNKIWRKATESSFEICPIGILPWQSASMNPLLV